jgi:hypothetical protein
MFGPTLQALAPDVDAVVAEAEAETRRHAAKALTGLGARFDGVLSAMLLQAWRRD